jgi:hypothetical protein
MGSRSTISPKSFYEFYSNLDHPHDMRRDSSPNEWLAVISADVYQYISHLLIFFASRLLPSRFRLSFHTYIFLTMPYMLHVSPISSLTRSRSYLRVTSIMFLIIRFFFDSRVTSTILWANKLLTSHSSVSLNLSH